MPIMIIETPNEAHSEPLEFKSDKFVLPEQVTDALHIPVYPITSVRTDVKGIETFNWPFPIVHVSVADWANQEKK